MTNGPCTMRLWIRGSFSVPKMSKRTVFKPAKVECYQKLEDPSRIRSRRIFVSENVRDRSRKDRFELLAGLETSLLRSMSGDYLTVFSKTVHKSCQMPKSAEPKRRDSDRVGKAYLESHRSFHGMSEHSGKSSHTNRERGHDDEEEAPAAVIVPLSAVSAAQLLGMRAPAASRPMRPGRPRGDGGKDGPKRFRHRKVLRVRAQVLSRAISRFGAYAPKRVISRFPGQHSGRDQVVHSQARVHC